MSENNSKYFKKEELTEVTRFYEHGIFRAELKINPTIYNEGWVEFSTRGGDVKNLEYSLYTLDEFNTLMQLLEDVKSEIKHITEGIKNKNER